MIYNELIEELFFFPKHVGVINTDDTDWVKYSAFTHTKTCIELYLQWDSKGFIKNLYFKTNGSPYTIAGLEWMCRKYVGTDLNSDLIFNNAELMLILHIPNTHFSLAIQITKAFDELIILAKNTFNTL